MDHGKTWIYIDVYKNLSAIYNSTAMLVGGGVIRNILTGIILGSLRPGLAQIGTVFSVKKFFYKFTNNNGCQVIVKAHISL